MTAVRHFNNELTYVLTEFLNGIARLFHCLGYRYEQNTMFPYEGTGTGLS